ncbi:conserved Plasmodium protein, unknown function [Plasmodium berghei]|uniref:Uncharacterized protein n=2 Tax=Plasmodium berghei TaxID=5821 RepID=A0A509AQQ3_PLABA|nr:conserved Plasmodium protein, unknown function [Plasmodium berghei ANKA]CXI79925.1 conserved Plasmodium protein, unknown function [Plasmodium berghei]SCM25350.1 conserved Plasmodium protein, unknown function [Plasmodium berghei]SCN27341.1 conserved Plasmodium protein, unknown function [Plasmodium berghei]SCO61980.1 conserved Plasmodium protein, unknown function [Plasmodium berghei]SCO63766.1 conserved Plasmodium protein, unknown function [Plasmodium berghei]|eukprot:XP_034422975.1 conserved Plasmodium protein, unknown function [Plasmodium berghei ANKA]
MKGKQKKNDEIDNSLFTVSRYIPDGEFNENDFTKVVEKKKEENEVEYAKKKEKEKEENVNKTTKNNFTNVNNLDMIDEQTWFNNLIKKTDQQNPSENSYESEYDENIIINSDNIFKNIYPFFKTEEDPNYFIEKKELHKFIKQNRLN